MNCIKEGAFIQFLKNPVQDLQGDALALAEELNILGRGGAGYPMAEKLKTCKAFDGEKTAICNAFGLAGDSVASWLAQNGAWAMVAGLRMAAAAVGASRLVLYYNGADGAAEEALKAAAGNDIELVSGGRPAVLWRGEYPDQRTQRAAGRLAIFGAALSGRIRHPDPVWRDAGRPWPTLPLRGSMLGSSFMWPVL